MSGVPAGVGSRARHNFPRQLSAMGVFLVAVVAIIAVALGVLLVRHWRLQAIIDRVPGPRTQWLFGNALQLRGHPDGL